MRFQVPPRRLPVLLVAIIPCWIGGPTLLGQRGDKEGHEMDPPPAHWKIPAAPVVAPEKALGTFAVPEGFRVELVAAEPMIDDPVAIAFDGDGRIWVVEMRSYMPEIDGRGEDQPTGRISVLEDTDGDGAIDRNTVFLDRIVMPRAVSLTAADQAILYADGVGLYEVAIVRGKDGRLSAGERTVVDPEYAKGGNPEHKPNGLLHGLDNWIYSSKCEYRYRRLQGKWVKEKTEFRGQWGIDQDDFGRLYTNTNSNFVSAEEVAAGLTVRNPNHEFRSTVTAKLGNQSTWPSRITPGVNRGYMKGTLTEDGFLVKPTAASGLAVYRGDQFPGEFYGNLFMNEPGGNLVKRAIVTEKDGRLSISQAYDGREFFTSTDERSRIVNGYTAPDGTLYLVDFYRGILQHLAYMTTYLRRQVEERGLDKPAGLGRIWRVAHDGKPLGPQPRMSGESDIELVAHLSHPNGWWRDTAQRLLVERGADPAALEALHHLAGDSKAGERARIHAVWTLEGLGELTADDVAAAFDPGLPKLAAETLHAAECLASGPDSAVIVGNVSKKLTSAKAIDPGLRRQVLASLGVFAAGDESGAFEALRQALVLPADPKETDLGRDLALSGLAGRELAFLKDVVAHRPEREVTGPLIMAVVRSNDAAAMKSLLDLVATAPGAHQGRLASELATAAAKLRRAPLADDLLKLASANAALVAPVVDGLLDGRKQAGSKFKPLVLKAAPALVSDPKAIPDRKKRDQLAGVFDFSGAAEVVFLKSDEDRALFESGKQHYAVICGACHQPHGKGQEFIAPPLVDSEWVLGSPARLIALSLDGVMGPITVDGKRYDAPEIQPVMPGMRANPEVDDYKLAAMLTYIRNEWGHGATPITPEMVKKARDEGDFRAPYTEDELKKIK